MPIVRLTAYEYRIAKWVGRERRAYASAEVLDPGSGKTSELAFDDACNDIMGAAGEYATAILLNLCWRPAIGQVNQVDVGGCIEVRTTAKPNGHLLIKPNFKALPHVLMIELTPTEYRFAGWREPVGVVQSYELECRGGREPAYWVPQSDLNDLETLLTYMKATQ